MHHVEYTGDFRKMPNESKRRYYTLDILKFIMSIIIVFHHFQQLTGTRFTKIIDFYDGDYSFGFFIVSAFFMISGFLEAGRIETGITGSFKDYMIPKALRIYPMVIVSVIYTTIVLIIGHGMLGEWIYVTPDLWAIFISCLLIFAGGPLMGVENALNFPTWYLGVLLLCYILVWVINKLYKKLNMDPIYGYIIALFIATSALYNDWRIPFINIMSARGFSAFIIGMLIYKVCLRFNNAVRLKWSIFVLSLSYGLFIVDKQLILNGYIQNYAFQYVIVPAILILLVALEGLFKTNSENNLIKKSIIAFGGISFEVYVWHYGMLVTMAVIKAIMGKEWGYNFIHMMIFTVGVLCWSAIMYFGVEKNLIAIVRGKIGLK